MADDAMILGGYCMNFMSNKDNYNTYCVKWWFFGSNFASFDKGSKNLNEESTIKSKFNSLIISAYISKISCLVYASPEATIRSLN